jgi:DNA-binding MarR family transcriptional regulator
MSLDRDQYMGLAGFRLALRQFLAASEVISRQAGITPQQYQALLAVATWDGEAMNMKDLADQLLLTHHAAVQLVDRMAKAGLVERQPSQTDRRSVNLALTRRGRRAFEGLAELHLEQMLQREPLLTESLRRLRQVRKAAARTDR